jgi:hypothetical protein
MKVFSEERRVFYSDGFPHGLVVTALGNVDNSRLKVQVLHAAPPLDNAEKEAQRSLRLTSWLAKFGTLLPPVMPMGPWGPEPFPLPFDPGAWLSTEELAAVAVKAAGGAVDFEHIFSELAPFPLRFFHRRSERLAPDPNLDEVLRGFQIPIAASPLRDVTLGDIYDRIRSLYVVRNLVPGAVLGAAGLQTVRAFLDGQIMLALTYAGAGFAATVILHAAKVGDAFSDMICREFAAESIPPPPPPPAPEQGPRVTRRRRGRGGPPAS